jgi:transcriptional regulator with XRE-family HTH domain
MPKTKPDERCMFLGKNVKRLREKQHLSQEKLSEKVDVHVSYIGQIERGLRFPSLKILFRISDALEVRINELFRGIDARKNGKEKRN